MKGIVVSASLCLGAFALPAHASYYETWTVEGKVVEVYGEKETDKVLETNKDLVAYRIFLGPNKERVVEHYTGKEADKNRKRNEGLKRDSTFAGLKIRVTNVKRSGGHGAMRKPKTEQEIDVVLNYDLRKVKGELRKDMVLKIRYEYANGLGPEGVVHSDNWQLLEIVEN